MHVRTLAGRLVTFAVALVAMAAPRGASAVTMKLVEARMAGAAADAVGVNTHLSYENTVYYKDYEAIIVPRLLELGVRHIRDRLRSPGDGNNQANKRFAELARKYGIQLLLIHDESGRDVDWTHAELKRLHSLDPHLPVVEMIEPANERDAGWLRDWDRLYRHVRQIHTLYQSDPMTRSIPIAGPSFANTLASALTFATAHPDVNEYFGCGNLHAYSGRYPESALGGGWGVSLGEAVDRYRRLCPDGPMINSETGYKMSGAVSGHPCVSQRAAAKYAPRLVLFGLKKGIRRTYFYQLINDTEDFGLLNDDGTPRQQFLALKNFMVLMKDSARPFRPGSLRLGLDGETEAIETMLFRKHNGVFYLILWQAVNGSTGSGWDHTTDIEHPDRPVTVYLGSTFQQANVYRPSFNRLADGGHGLRPVATFRNLRVLRLQVPDHILVVELIGAPSRGPQEQSAFEGRKEADDGPTSVPAPGREQTGRRVPEPR